MTKTVVSEANVDKGYRGHDYKGDAVVRLAGSSNRGLTPSERKRKRRRSAIEPIIGHLKSDHRLDRCFLHGRTGDALNLIGSAAGSNMRKLIRLLGRGIFSHARIEFGWIFEFSRRILVKISSIFARGRRSAPTILAPVC